MGNDALFQVETEGLFRNHFQVCVCVCVVILVPSAGSAPSNWRVVIQ